MFTLNLVSAIALMLGVFTGDFTQLTAQTVTPKPERYILPGDNIFPEGIAYQGSTGDFFIGSSTDGTILRGGCDLNMIELQRERETILVELIPKLAPTSRSQNQSS